MADITWPRGDTKFLFECWRIFHEWAQRTSEILFQHEKRNFVSPSDHVMFFLLYKQQWNTKPFHFNSFLIWKARFIMGSHSKGDIFTCEENMLFSHVNISSFRAKAHLVFHWCLYNNKSQWSVVTPKKLSHEIPRKWRSNFTRIVITQVKFWKFHVWDVIL